MDNNKSKTIGIKEASDSSKLFDRTVCGTNGRLLIKDCIVNGKTGDHQKTYKALDVGAGLQIGGLVDTPELKTLGNNNTGTLIIDDGANWRVTLQFSGGVMTNAPTIAASSAATASWSPFP